MGPKNGGTSVQRYSEVVASSGLIVFALPYFYLNVFSHKITQVAAKTDVQENEKTL